MAINPQPATTPLPFRTRPAAARPPHRVVQVVRPSRVLTVAKITGLAALTMLGVVLTVAVIAGVAVFAVLNVG